MRIRLFRDAIIVFTQETPEDRLKRPVFVVALIRGKISTSLEQLFSMGQLFNFVSLYRLNVSEIRFLAHGYEQRKNRLSHRFVSDRLNPTDQRDIRLQISKESTNSEPQVVKVVAGSP
jgi:hypothetical protein